MSDTTQSVCVVVRMRDAPRVLMYLDTCSPVGGALEEVMGKSSHARGNLSLGAGFER